MTQPHSRLISLPKTGTTLLELSLLSFLMTLMSLILLQLHQASSSGLATVRAQAVLRMQLTQALNALSQDAVQAKQDSPAGGTCGVSNTTTGKVIFLLSRLDASGNPTGSFDDMVCYELCGVGPPSTPNLCTATGELWRHVDPQPGSTRPSEHRKIAQYLSTFTYSWPLGPQTNRILISLAAERTEGGRRYRELPQNNFTVEFSLRNWNQ